MQHTGEAFDLGVGSFHQMETAEQHVDARIQKPRSEFLPPPDANIRQPEPAQEEC
jgi:hypothetical protein